MVWARDEGERSEEGEEGSGEVLLSAGTADPELDERYLKKKKKKKKNMLNLHSFDLSFLVALIFGLKLYIVAFISPI